MGSTWRRSAGHGGALSLLAALWGGSFLFIGLAVDALGPFPLMALRVGIAWLALAAYAAAIGRSHELRMTRGLLVLGTLNAAIPFTLIAAAQLRLTVSVAAILNATMPLFAAVVASLVSGERVGPRRAMGLALGIAGVGFVVGWTPVRPDPAWWLAAAASLLAGLSYACAGVYAARRLTGLPPLALAAGQQLAAALLLAPIAIAWPPRAWPPAEVIVAVLALGLLSTAVGFVLYFFLVTSAGPVTAASVTFLIPLFGVMFGTIALHDSVGFGTIAGLASILAGVVLIRDAPREQPAGPSLGRARPAAGP